MKFIFAAIILVVSFPAKSLVPNREAQLTTTIFDEDSSLEVRWKAYQAFVKDKKEESLPVVHRAIKSHDWFLRQAGLTTLMAIDPNEAKQTARNLLQTDPSLLVRAQALSAIKILNDKDSEKILWTALEDKKNFRGDQSLWIRPKIVATLMEFKLGQKDQYKKLLEDPDVQVQRLAQIALKK